MIIYLKSAQSRNYDFENLYTNLWKIFSRIYVFGEGKNMKQLISFIIRAEKGFLKKPDINDGIYLTYNMLHKPAILGILGAIIGLEGYKQNNIFPEYYKQLKDIPIGVKPIGDANGSFQKTIITYNNTTGFASYEEGGNLIITEQTLICPSYEIYLLLDLENVNQAKLNENINNQRAEYLPYLGKNDYSLWWNKGEVKKYEWKEVAEASNPFTLSTLFIKNNFSVEGIKYDETQDFDLLDFSNLSEDEQFAYFERLPVNHNEALFQYNYEDFAYTNFKLKANILLDNLYIIRGNEYIQLN